MRKLLGVIVLALALAGCGDRAKDLYETAVLEEKQFNQTQAVRLYTELMEKYPASSYAARAQERLKELAAEDKQP
ncbi:MAG: hypothetical protein SCI25_04355 [Desulfuromonadales bacterium]|nr:hypothetical protein [Desulfuromonadales bacterium]MDW7758050.1 hypothetical protein [Desulfuromonadales bacterium]